MDKPDNKYNPGTIPYRILQGDGTWDNMSVTEIASILGCTYRTAQAGFLKIKDDLGYIVQRRDGRKSPVSENGNIYRPGSKLWILYEGDWSKKTISEIAVEICTTKTAVCGYICKIGKETGKYIDFRDGRKKGG